MTREGDDSTPPARLRAAVARTGLPLDQLWLRYFTLGGLAGPLEVEAFVEGLLPLSVRERDVYVHALNERLLELGDTDLLPYSFDHPGR